MSCQRFHDEAIWIHEPFAIIYLPVIFTANSWTYSNCSSGVR